jgi:hypothetical protein
MLSNYSLKIYYFCRVKADILQKDRNKGAGSRPGAQPPAVDDGGNANESSSKTSNNGLIPTESPAVDPFASPPVFSADGKTPRVKADIVNQLVQNGGAAATATGGPPAVGRKQGSKKVELDRTQLNKIDFVQPNSNTDAASVTTTTTEPPFLGPDVKPDGRSPRVKANILAKKQQLPGNSNKLGNDGEEINKKGKKVFDSAATAAPFIPTPRPPQRPTTSTNLNPFFSEPAAGFTLGPDEESLQQGEEEGGEVDEEEVHGAFFTSTALPLFPTASPTFSTATGSGFDPFNLGPPPQPKIPESVLSRLPPPANRKLPVAIFTSPAPFTTAPPLPPIEQQFTIDSDGNINDNTAGRQTSPLPPLSNSGRGDSGRFLPPAQGGGRSGPRVKANELAKLNNQATRFRTSEPQKIFTNPDIGNRGFQSPRQPFGPPERVRNQQVQPFENGILDGNEDDQLEDDQNDNSQSDVGQDDGGEIFPATQPPLPLQEPPTARPRQNFKFVRPEENQLGGEEAANGKCSNPFKCPPRTFAGGRKPRVKSNIKALDRNFWHPETRQSRVIKRRKQQHVRISPVLKAEILGRRQGRRQQDRPGDELLQQNGIGDTQKNKEGFENRDPTVKKQQQPRQQQREEQHEQQQQHEEQLVTTPDPLASLQQLVREKEREARVLNNQVAHAQSLLGTEKADFVDKGQQPLQFQDDNQQEEQQPLQFQDDKQEQLFGDPQQQQQQQQQQLEVVNTQQQGSLFTTPQPTSVRPDKKSAFNFKQNNK